MESLFPFSLSRDLTKTFTAPSSIKENSFSPLKSVPVIFDCVHTCCSGMVSPCCRTLKKALGLCEHTFLLVPRQSSVLHAHIKLPAMPKFQNGV